MATLKKNRRGISGFLIVIFVVIGVFLVAVSATGSHMWSVKESIDIYNRYFTTAMDKEVESLKQGFVKTAAFFSLNSLSKEFTEYGGYAKRTILDANNNGIGDPTEGKVPDLRVKPTVTDILFMTNHPFWTIPDCENVLKRVPYLRDTDPNLPALDKLLLIMPNDKDHKQYIEEINAAKYPLYVSILVLMTKKGTLKVECRAEDGCLEMERLTGTPDTIDKDGIYNYKIKKIDGAKTLTMLHVTGKNSTGDVEHVAQIKHVLASIYDPSAVTIPNVVFTEYLDKYQESMADTLTERNTKSDVKLTVAQLEGIVTRGYSDTIEGIVWPDDAAGGIKADVKDVIGGNAVLSQIQNSGLVTEEAKIRYYKLYSYAEKFTDQSQTLLQSRLWDMLHSLDENGHSGPSGDNCGRPDCSDPAWCPNDEVKSYTRAETYSAIAGAINNVAAEYTALTSPDGISWTMEYDNADYAAHDPTNVNIGACDTAEHIESNNFEYIEYIKATYTDIGDDCACEPVSLCNGCGSTSYNYKDRNRCTMDYDHRYILKNLKVFVTITDDKNKYYSADTNSWDKLQFKFFVTVPIVDMNCCGPAGGTHFCENHGSACSNPYGVVTPSLAPSGPFAITSGPTAGLSGISATIAWTTNRLSDSKLKYSTTSGGPYTEVTDPTMVLAHSIGIGGLIANQQYFFVVESNDGTTTVTSSEYTFTTGTDNSEPFAGFISPKDGDAVGKTINVNADAHHSSGISKVDFYVYSTDAASYVLAGTSTAASSPYVADLDLTAILGVDKELGVRPLKIVAYSNAGTENSTTVDVTVTMVPSITAFNLEKGTDYAKVTFDIDFPAKCVIRYGTTAMYGSATDITPEAKHHVVSITGLAASTDYYYQIELTNPQGLTTIVKSDMFRTNDPVI